MKNTNVETLLGTNEKETKRMNKGLRSLLSGVSLAIVGSLCVGLVLLLLLMFYLLCIFYSQKIID